MRAQTATAVAASSQALQERAAFSHGTTRLVRSRSRVLRDALLVGLIGLPVDVAGMMILDENLPLFTRQHADALAAHAGGIECVLRARLAIDVGTGIDGVRQNLVDSVVAGFNPADLGMRVHLQRQLQPLIAEPQPDAARRSCLGKTGKDGADCVDHGRVGMKEHLAVRIPPHEARRQAASQLAALRLVANAAVEPGPEHVQFRLAHRAFEPEQQAVVESGRMIEAVAIADQRVGEAREIDQSMPVRIVAGEPRDFEAEQQSNAGECDLGCQPRKSGARDGTGAGEPEVLVYDDDALLGPAEFACASGESVLTVRRLTIVLDLVRAGLAQVDDGLSRETARRDLGALIHDPPPAPALPRACGR